MPASLALGRSLQTKLFTVSIPPTGKKLDNVRQLLDLSFGFSDKFARTIGVISKQFTTNNNIITVVTCRLSPVIRSPDHANISRKAFYAED